MVDERKQIKVSEEVKTFLDKNKLVEREPYDGVLRRLLKMPIKNLQVVVSPGVVLPMKH
ncbi:hypothetical protein LCGC14_2268830 [marine sediment metagenome]|uniref:Uncharacterized protein n=1 Tax=marine sediment metagenome TaxID=412755 RepID=A0A0F9CXL2_9ZZZZ